MKKLLCLLLIPMIVLTSACGKPYAFRDNSFYTMLAKQTDLAFPALSFASANELNSDTLYLFFHFFVKTNALYANGEDFKKKDHYEIPITCINKVLSDYLEVKNFDATKLSNKNLYDKNKGVIKTKTLPVFGGSRHVKLIDKKYLGGNKVQFTASFYNDHKKFLYSKTMVIYQKSNENNYQIISIDNTKSK